MRAVVVGAVGTLLLLTGLGAAASTRPPQEQRLGDVVVVEPVPGAPSPAPTTPEPVPTGEPTPTAEPDPTVAPPVLGPAPVAPDDSSGSGRDDDEPDDDPDDLDDEPDDLDDGGSDDD